MQAAELTSRLPTLRQYALKLAKNPADADDLVQSTAERALRFADRYQDGTNLVAWLAKIMTNEYRHGRRAWQTRNIYYSDEPPDEPIDTAAPYWRLQWLDFVRAMRLMPADERQAVIDGYRCGPLAAARRDGANLSTYKSRFARARRRLQARCDGA